MTAYRTAGPQCQVKNWFDAPNDGGTSALTRHEPPGPRCQVQYWFADHDFGQAWEDSVPPADAFGVPAGRIAISDRIDPGIENLEKIDKYGEAYKSIAQGRLFRLDSRALRSFRALRAAARAAGFDQELFTLTSDYRSSKKQAGLAARARAQYGSREDAGIFVAQGHSEHITGRAFDLHLGISNSGANALARNFDALPQYQWLKANAAQFGLNPYPYSDGKHPGEPWHWSYNVK